MQTLRFQKSKKDVRARAASINKSEPPQDTQKRLVHKMVWVHRILSQVQTLRFRAKTEQRKPFHKESPDKKQTPKNPSEASTKKVRSKHKAKQKPFHKENISTRQVDGAGVPADPPDHLPHHPHLAAGLRLHGDPHHPRHPWRLGSGGRWAAEGRRGLRYVQLLSSVCLTFSLLVWKNLRTKGFEFFQGT